MFSEINMKDIPEAIEATKEVPEQQKQPTNDFDFMSRLMDLNKNSNPSSANANSNKSGAEKNFLDRLMDIFFKRSNENEDENEEEENNEEDDGESREKRSELENNHGKDFGSLLYLGKRLGAVSETNRHRANLDYANMYHSNSNNNNQKSVFNLLTYYNYYLSE